MLRVSAFRTIWTVRYAHHISAFPSELHHDVLYKAASTSGRLMRPPAPVQDLVHIPPAAEAVVAISTSPNVANTHRNVAD